MQLYLDDREKELVYGIRGEVRLIRQICATVSKCFLGIDDEANVANFVETETIVSIKVDFTLQ